MNESRLIDCDQDWSATGEIWQELERFPGLPEWGLELVRRRKLQKQDIDLMVQLLEDDPIVAERLSRLSDRWELGSRAVLSAQELGDEVGWEKVRAAFLSILIFESIGAHAGSSVRPELFDEFWRHGVAVGAAAELLAEDFDRSAAEAFWSGLVHDIGRIALAIGLPKTYQRVLGRAGAAHRPLLEVEREILEVDHAVAGAYLAQVWGLPDRVAECIWLHHHDPEALPASVSDPALIRLVHLGNLLVREQRIGLTVGPNRCGAVQRWASRWGISDERLASVRRKLPAKVHRGLRWLGRGDEPYPLFGRRSSPKAAADPQRNLPRPLRTGSSEPLQDFDAMSRFFEAVKNHAGPGHVARSAAAACAALLHLESAACLILPADSSVVQVGIARGASLRSERVQCPGRFRLSDWVGQARGPRPGLIALPPGMEGLGFRYAEELGPPPWWIFPGGVGEVTMGIVFSCPLDRVLEIGRRDRRLQTLIAAAATVAASSVRAIRWQRMAEELALEQRRTVDQQDDRVRARTISMIAEMASGAAHELNTPLAVISGRAQLLLGRAEREEAGRPLRVISQQAHRASQTVSDLMDFAKPDPPRPEAFNLGRFLEQLREDWLAKSSLGPHQIVVMVADSDIFVRGDIHQIQRAFDALIANAAEACEPTQAYLEINCRGHATDDSFVVAITDNGCGMTADVMQRACDPFFSFRSAGRGQGLGLSRAYRLVEINGGRIRMESVPGEGTTVYVTLPAATTPENVPGDDEGGK